jgi:hypothetical protein
MKHKGMRQRKVGVSPMGSAVQAQKRSSKKRKEELKKAKKKKKKKKKKKNAKCFML